MTKRAPIRVGIETTDKKTFASALDWPGWSRSGKTPEAALEALAAAHDRYAAVAALAGETLPAGAAFEVVEERPGDATTAFGAPSIAFDADRQPLTAAQARRQAALVEAAFMTFDRVVAAAPAELRKGPRGGGRDRDKVVEHVEGSHEGYTRPAGARVDKGATDADRRAAMLEVLARASDGEPGEGAKWPPRYAARRIAWHAMDHAWEIEDRSDG
jgi:predicted RNase H-like HicB family nuclease